MYQQETATVHLFLMVSTKNSLVLFSEHILRTPILTQASLISIDFLEFFLFRFYIFSLDYSIFQR